MVDFFTSAMAFMWLPENDGQTLHTSANDPGGSTAWGVTYATWVGWQNMHHEPATFAVFSACKQADFLPLYRAMYWNACRCGNMGALGVQVFDIAMNSGPGNAARFLQKVLGVAADGELGPVTLAALNNADPKKVNQELFEKREAFYASLPTARFFERGWDRRATACRDLVASLLAGNNYGSNSPSPSVPL